MDIDNNSAINYQFEQLHSKYQGTGNPNTKRSEWGDNILRDTASSNLMHQSRLSYFAIAENVTKARINFRMLQSMISASLRKTSLSESSTKENGQV
ncbi:putative splicing factor 3B subunit 5 [Cryptosporidium felis]|nr:putative splicing factor 3B subunit 5 [Cryptosporidium felis]